MSAATAQRLTLKSLIELLEPRFGGPRELDEPRPLEQLILVMLSRGSSMKKARQALKRLQSDYVDWNDVRVTSPREIAAKISVVGEKIALRRAEQLLELLSTVYLRFNKMNLDFLLDRQSEDAARKRAKLFAWLSERSYAYPAMLQFYGVEKPEVVVDGGLPRVLARLGLVEPKLKDAAIRQKLTDQIGDGEHVIGHFLLYVLSEEFCLAKTPDCPHCPAREACPSAKLEEEKQKPAPPPRKKAAPPEKARKPAKVRSKK